MLSSFDEEEHEQQNDFDDSPIGSIFNIKDSHLLTNSINDFDSLTLPNPSPFPNPNPELTVENKINKFIVIEEKSTAVTNKIFEITIKQNDEYLDIPNPKYYPFDVIKQIFIDNNIQQKFIDIIIEYKEDHQLKEAEKDIIHKKTKVYNYQNKNANYDKFKSGRKKKDDSTERKHSKISPDNIIKKLKSKFIDFLMKFVNNLIPYINLKKGEREGEGKIKLLKKVNYKKYIDNMNRKQNLIILQKPIKDILSYEISTKFSKYSRDWNKNLINSILECNIEDNNIIFNMKFNEWIDYFLLKNKGNIYPKIEKYLPKINALLEYILAKNDEYYLSKFIFYLYNYEKWFYNKVGRNRNL